MKSSYAHSIIVLFLLTACQPAAPAASPPTATLPPPTHPGPQPTSTPDPYDFELVEVETLGRGNLHNLIVCIECQKAIVDTSTGVWLYDLTDSDNYKWLSGKYTSGLSLSPNNRFFVFHTMDYSEVEGFEDQIEIWDAHEGEKITEVQGSGKEIILSGNLIWSSNSQYLIAIEENNFFVWDTNTWKLISQISADWHASKVTISPNNKWLAVSANNTTIVWELGSKEPLFTIPPKSHLNSLDWTPDNHLILQRRYDDLEIMDIEKQEIIRTVPFQTFRATQNVWSPIDFHILATIVYESDDPRFVIKIWNMNTSDLISELTISDSDFENANYGLLWAQDGTKIAMVNPKNRALIFDPFSGNILDTNISITSEFQEEYNYFSPENQVIQDIYNLHPAYELINTNHIDDELILMNLLYGDYIQQRLHIWDFESLSTMSIPNNYETRGAVQNGVSPDGRYLFYRDYDYAYNFGGLAFVIWDIDDKSVLYKTHPSFNPHISWSPDGQHFTATSHSNTEAYIFDMGKLEYQKIFSMETANSEYGPETLLSSWSPDGKFIVVGDDLSNLHIYDYQNSVYIKQIEAFENPKFSYANPIDLMAWSPDNQYLAISGLYEDLVIFETENWTVIKHIQSEDSGFGFGALSWSPDSQFLIGSGYAYRYHGKYYIWETSSWNLIKSENFSSGTNIIGINNIKWASKNEYIAFSLTNGQVKIYEIEYAE